jgi:hypothetical protein
VGTKQLLTSRTYISAGTCTSTVHRDNKRPTSTQNLTDAEKHTQCDTHQEAIAMQGKQQASAVQHVGDAMVIVIAQVSICTAFTGEA